MLQGLTAAHVSPAHIRGAVSPPLEGGGLGNTHTPYPAYQITHAGRPSMALDTQTAEDRYSLLREEPP